MLHGPAGHHGHQRSSGRRENVSFSLGFPEARDEIKQPVSPKESKQWGLFA